MLVTKFANDYDMQIYNNNLCRLNGMIWQIFISLHWSEGARVQGLQVAGK